MPSKNRRLPGGKVRKLQARPRAALPTTESTAPPDANSGVVGVPPASSDPNGAPPVEAAARVRPGVRPGAMNGERSRGGLTSAEGPPATLLPPARAQGTPSDPGAPGAPGPAGPRRRGAVIARSVDRSPVRRPGAASLDLAEASLTHIRRDLLRIAILSAVMIGVIVGVAVVLR